MILVRELSQGKYGIRVPSSNICVEIETISRSLQTNHYTAAKTADCGDAIETDVLLTS